MITLNKKRTVLTILFDPNKDDLQGCNVILSKINSIMTIFKHEDGYRIIDTKGKFHKLNKQLKIKL